jgi:carboxyl-terminal processing protease
MDYREQSGPGLAERTARWAVVVFLMLAIVTLAFGLGWGVSDLNRGGTTTSTTTRTSPATTNQGDAATSAAILDEICNILKNQYVDRDTIDPKTCRAAAINGVLASLNDPHTAYLTPDDLKAGALDLGSTYQGIGATVSDQSGAVQIVAPFRDSPAEKAGVQAGDLILEVDGEKTDGWSNTLAVQRIRGPVGTSVTLKVKHPDGSTATLTVVRGEIEKQSVFTDPRLDPIPGEAQNVIVDRAGNPAPDIAYLAISQFHDNTANELRAKLKDIAAGNYKGLVIDLRSNPGGLLSATIDVADEFLDSGTILSEVDAGGKKQSWTAHTGGLLTKMPMVILQDQGSASGAEVLAAALRDNGRAKIVGTRSFGKGTVNQLQELKDCGDPNGCGALYLSVGRWLTPKGDQIEGLGVTPDVEVPMTSQDYIDKGDIQLFAAIDILRGK